MLFILFYLILFLIVHITMTFARVLRETCMCPLVYFPPFLVNDLHFIISLLIHFSFAIIVSIIIVIITIILFFSTISVTGVEFSKWIRAALSTPTHWLLWVSLRVSIIFIFLISSIIIIFFISYSLVTTVGVLTPSFRFIIFMWHHLIMMPTRQGM